MRAQIGPRFASMDFASEAQSIVTRCVHCGFCNATCPTYQLTGDELEGPRGRIYLIKSLLEDGEVSVDTRKHLDQCLLCRNCETTCPSGVPYGSLLELVRPQVQALTATTPLQRLKRLALLSVVPKTRLFAALVALGRVFRPLLPTDLKRLIPPPRELLPVPKSSHARKVLLLRGCAEPGVNANIGRATAVVLDRLGFKVSVADNSGCCGALARHLGDEDAANRAAIRNIEAWWPSLEDGAEAVCASSSGCGLELTHYAALFAADERYASKARQITERSRDPLQLVIAQVGKLPQNLLSGERIALQAPCTLQHGLRLGGELEGLLKQLGADLLPVAESHLCCGSAGTYSIMQPQQSKALRQRKLNHLERHQPTVIVTSNVGCQAHLEQQAKVPVKHWLELLAEKL